jgi:hypothetical protein
VLVDVHGVLVADDVVIPRQHQRRRSDGFECLELYVGLVDRIPFKALPPSVRKASGFPVIALGSSRGCASASEA